MKEVLQINVILDRTETVAGAACRSGKGAG